MSAPETHVISTDGSASRRILLDELVWLWRTAQLPADTKYLDANGEWKPVSELVDPLIEKEVPAPVEQKMETPRLPGPNRPLRVLAFLVLGFGFCVAIKVAWRIFTGP